MTTRSLVKALVSPLLVLLILAGSPSDGRAAQAEPNAAKQKLADALIDQAIPDWRELTSFAVSMAMFSDSRIPADKKAGFAQSLIIGIRRNEALASLDSYWANLMTDKELKEVKVFFDTPAGKKTTQALIESRNVLRRSLPDLLKKLYPGVTGFQYVAPNEQKGR